MKAAWSEQTRGVYRNMANKWEETVRTIQDILQVVHDKIQHKLMYQLCQSFHLDYYRPRSQSVSNSD